MKTKYYLILLAILISISALWTNEVYKFYRASDGGELKLQDFFKSLLEYDVIFFGEIHDNDLLHQLEIAILQGMYGHFDKLAISMEMFERDTQNVLNAYLSGEIMETEFLDKSHPWPNYQTDYHPLVEFARINGMEILAANVPRKYAAMVSREGWSSIEKLPPEERKLMSADLLILDDEYKQRFYATIQSHPGIKNSSMGSIKPKALYEAQCLKDDTMAESISKFLQGRPETKLMHINGHFHSDYHLGTVKKLQLKEPDLKIAVISPVIWDQEDKELEFMESEKEKGDYILIIR